VRCYPSECANQCLRVCGRYARSCPMMRACSPVAAQCGLVSDVRPRGEWACHDHASGARRVVHTPSAPLSCCECAAARTFPIMRVHWSRRSACTFRVWGHGATLPCVRGILACVDFGPDGLVAFRAPVRRRGPRTRTSPNGRGRSKATMRTKSLSCPRTSRRTGSCFRASHGT
jgi:hypothetical protein